MYIIIFLIVFQQLFTEQYFNRASFSQRLTDNAVGRV